MSTTTATPSAPASGSTPTFKADVADAASQLLATLVAATGQAADQLKGYVDGYAQDYADVAVMLATAKMANDADGIALAEDELRVLNDDAMLDAATAGIQVQSAEEATLEKVLTGVFNALVAHLLA